MDDAEPPTLKPPALADTLSEPGRRSRPSRPRRKALPVGILFYGTSRLPIPYDDRALAHLQIVMIAKFRRHEGFTLSWIEADNSGARSTVWVAPTCELHFQFFGSRSPVINRQWLEQLAVLANTSSGLRMTEEADLPVAETPL